MDNVVIGFTGNRYGITKKQKIAIKNILAEYENMTVMHGDCVGADSDFHDICVKYRKNNPDKKLTIHIFPPTDNKHRAFKNGDLIMKQKPYLRRNDDILKNSDILIACPIDKDNEILRSGTWSTIRKARKQNKIIHLL